MDSAARLPKTFINPLCVALLGCASTLSTARLGLAQGTPESAPVSSSGVNVIESSGVYPTTTNGNNHYLDAGAGYTYPSFSVLDFSASSFSLGYTVGSLSNLNLTLTESQDSSSKAGSFSIYLSEDTASIATANGGSPLKYQTANGPSGLGTQLGTPSTLFKLATFTSDASTSGSTTDTFSLALSSSAQTYLINQLNTSGADIRLVIASNDTAGYATFLGNTSAVATASQPTLSFNATLNQPSLNWTPGGSANGGSGTWSPANTAGDTNWGGGAWNNTIAVFGGTGGSVAIGAGGVSAQGVQFNATGYTVGASTGPTLTLTSASGTTAPSVQVTNTGDTATINAPIAGTSGLNKTGGGTLVLGGTNTFTGGLTISSGTLQVGSDANLGDASNAIALAGGNLYPVGSQTTRVGPGTAATLSGHLPELG